MNVIMEDRASKGRPRKTWRQVLCNDLRAKSLLRKDANDRIAWKGAIKC